MILIESKGYMLNQIHYYKDLLLVLTGKDIKVRYKSSYLGYLWSLANPLFLALIFYFVFKVVTKVKMENYTLFLISGLFIWQWINNAIMMGTNLYISNASLIKKVNFPRNFLVIASTLSEGFNFLVSIPVIIFFMLYYGEYPALNWLFLIPIILVPTFLFVYSLSLFVATVNLFFRDMERIIGLLLTFVFYLTPIIYPLKMIPDKYQQLIFINPFAPLVITWQNLFLHSTLEIKYFMISILYAIIAFSVATYTYTKLKYKFAELV